MPPVPQVHNNAQVIGGFVVNQNPQVNGQLNQVNNMPVPGNGQPVGNVRDPMLQQNQIYEDNNFAPNDACVIF